MHRGWTLRPIEATRSSAGDASPPGNRNVSASGRRWWMGSPASRWAGVARVCRQRARVACALALALMAAGCSADGLTTGTLVSGRNATIAFESIDGAPRPVFQKLVENLASEAVAHQVMVISREGPASYRVRGYMAAHLER